MRCWAKLSFKHAGATGPTGSQGIQGDTGGYSYYRALYVQLRAPLPWVQYYW